MNSVSRGCIGAAVVVLLASLTGCRGSSNDITTPGKVFGGQGAEDGQFVYPRAITIGPAGHVYIVDKTARIQRFSPAGEFELGWRMPKWQAGKPTGISVDDKGRVLVADTHYHQVIIFDDQGKELHRFGEYGTEGGQFIYPTRVVVGPTGDIYVSEYGGNDRISRFSPEFEFITAFGQTPGADESLLARPQALLFDEQGELWVADSCHHRIVRFNSKGELVGSIGAPGREPGQLQYPYDLAFLPDGTLLVCEFGNNRVQQFDRSGKSLAVWGSAGHEPGQFASPWGVAAGLDGQVYVLDSRNNRVQMFRM